MFFVRLTEGSDYLGDVRGSVNGRTGLCGVQRTGSSGFIADYRKGERIGNK